MAPLFERYDIVTEIIMLGISMLMLMHIHFTKPEITKLLQQVITGFILSILAISSHILFLQIVSDVDRFSKNNFNVAYIIFGVFYILVLDVIFLYINQLSYERRAQMMKTFHMLLVFSIIYAVIIFYPMATDKLIVTEGKYYLTQWHLTHTYCGILNAVLIFAATIKNRKTLSHVVYVGTMIMLPLVIAGSMCQFVFPTLVITSFTYVMPLLLFYTLFHCAKYNEVVGCQSDDALFPMMDAYLEKNKKYVLVYVRLPQLQKEEFSNNKRLIDFTSAQICRKIEQLKFGLRIYTHNIFTYFAFCGVKDDDEGTYIAEQIKSILSGIVEFNGVQIEPAYKIIVIKDNNVIDSSDKIKSIIKMLSGRFSDNIISEYIEVMPKDLEEFDIFYTVEKELYDIKDKHDLDDERVVCMAQPIYCISSATYMTAEALMRLNINGKMYYPSQFIPIAENNNCIHILTMIILNKVCRQIKAMEEKYEFDASTINCCTEELELPSFSNEIMQVISQNNVSPSKIRLEVTESIAVRDFEGIYNNMSALNKQGIDFYLDDFGTGYSNLERLITYPFMMIKFDKSMLYKALEAQKADDLMAVLVEYFTSNGFHALVEGVEDSDQNVFAINKGFEYIQGYHYSKPQPVEQLVDYFRIKD